MKSWLATGIFFRNYACSVNYFYIAATFFLIPAEMRLMQSCCVRLYLRHFHTPKIFWTYWQISTHWSQRKSSSYKLCEKNLSQGGWLQCEQAPLQGEGNPLLGKVFIYKHLSMGSISGKAVSFFELKSIKFEALVFQQPGFNELISRACEDTDLQ